MTPHSKGPIDKLPFDVLSYLFRFCLPIFNDPKLVKEWLQDEPQGSFSLNKHVAPLLLCNLWTVIHHETSQLGSAPRKVTLAALDVWFQRSGHLPLWVYSNSPRIHKRFALHAHRIQRISIMAYFWTERDVPRAYRTASFPILEAIDIKSDLGVTPYSSLAYAPRLKKVIWFDPVTSWANGPGPLGAVPPFPWERLTKAHIATGITVRQGRIIMSQCPILEECMFSVVGTLTLDRFSDLTHRTITLLRIQMDSQLGLADFFHGLTLPSLRSVGLLYDDSKGLRFETINMWEEDSTGWNAFLEFLRRSRCALTSLQFTRWGLIEPMILELLELMTSSLDELVIDGFDSYEDEEFVNRHQFGVEDEPPVSIADNAVRRLTYSGAHQNPPCLCPRLTVLHLNNCIECDQRALAIMVASRRRTSGSVGVLRLEKVEIRMLERPSFSEDDEDDDGEDTDSDSSD
ncbi:hypothetical protein R3P38DRAFT_3407246 [Favolaschia claudopus]|uniref:F-box domain-containing protein n=1 Tax=Favolaschia claudopus TaxID=2862362 RepID=A0AAV9ZZK4_9AGAR